MSIQSKKEFEKQVFGEFEVSQKLPFKIVQTPYRKFSKYQREGHWNQKERLKYTVFLGFFQKLLEDNQLKKNARIYEMMSDMIITRNPSQCRSHHQKMQKHRKTIEDIIASVTDKYQPGVYEEIKTKYTIFIKTLLQNSDKYIREPTSLEKRKDKIRKTPSMKSSNAISFVNGKGEVVAEGKVDNRRTGSAYSDDEEQPEKEPSFMPNFDFKPSFYGSKPQNDINEEIYEEQEERQNQPQEKGHAEMKNELHQKSQEYLVKKQKSDSLVPEMEDEEVQEKRIENQRMGQKKQVRRTNAYSDDEGQQDHQNGRNSSGVIQPQPFRPQIMEMNSMWGGMPGQPQIIPFFVPMYNPQERITVLQKDLSEIQATMSKCVTEYSQKVAELNYCKSLCGQHHGL